VQEGYPGSLSEFGNREKWGALRHKLSKSQSSEVSEEIYTVDLRGDIDR
jgi:hypothetical protein